MGSRQEEARGWREDGKKEGRNGETGRQTEGHTNTHWDYPLCNPSTGGTEGEEGRDVMEGCAPNFSHQCVFGAKNVVLVCECVCVFF